MSWKEFLSTDRPFSETVIISPLRRLWGRRTGSGKQAWAASNQVFLFLRGTCRESKETHRFIPGVDSFETSRWWRGSQSRRCLDVRVGSCSGLPCPSPGDLPGPGMEPRVSCIAGTRKTSGSSSSVLPFGWRATRKGTNTRSTGLSYPAACIPASRKHPPGP